MSRLAVLTTSRTATVGVIAVLGMGSVVGAAVAADAATGRVRNAGDDLVVRSGPGTGYAKVGRISSGATIDIVCQTHGTTVNGRYGTSSWWDKIGANRYVSDVFVHTGSDGRVAQLCQSVGTTKPLESPSPRPRTWATSRCAAPDPGATSSTSRR